MMMITVEGDEEEDDNEDDDETDYLRIFISTRW